MVTGAFEVTPSGKLKMNFPGALPASEPSTLVMVMIPESSFKIVPFAMGDGIVRR